ncbi:MAG: DUF4159 domain-containing protein [Phycisphaerales bacterium]|nr:DUF4159 domain-containing protein [Phycisphaerales bacterium]
MRPCCRPDSGGQPHLRQASVCELFFDRFLQRALAETTIRTTGKLHPVPLAGSDLAPFPLLILAGEKNFALTPDEREQLKNYLQQGGFLLASAGCSSKQFDQSFRRELAELYPDTSLEPVPFTHPPVSHPPQYHQPANHNADRSHLAGPDPAESSGPGLRPRWPQRYRLHFRLLLLWRSGTPPRCRPQPQHPRVCAGVLMPPDALHQAADPGVRFNGPVDKITRLCNQTPTWALCSHTLWEHHHAPCFYAFFTRVDYDFAMDLDQSDFSRRSSGPGATLWRRDRAF